MYMYYLFTSTRSPFTHKQGQVRRRINPSAAKCKKQGRSRSSSSKSRFFYWLLHMYAYSYAGIPTCRSLLVCRNQAEDRLHEHLSSHPRCLFDFGSTCTCTCTCRSFLALGFPMGHDAPIIASLASKQLYMYTHVHVKKFPCIRYM